VFKYFFEHRSHNFVNEPPKTPERRQQLKNAMISATERTIENHGLGGLKARALAYRHQSGAPIDISRIAQVLTKADPPPDGLLGGFPHTMLDDTDISATRHVRAAVGGMIASLIGCPAAFVSGGAEHQGPPGGGPVAVIARVSE